jgi:hypothetical protein
MSRNDELRLVVHKRRWPQPEMEEVAVYKGPNFDFIEGEVIYVRAANKIFATANYLDLYTLVSRLPSEGNPKLDGEYLPVVYRQK